MRRWIIAGVTLALAAAAGVTVWLETGSDSSSGFTSPKAAVSAACHGGDASTPAPDMPNEAIGRRLFPEYLRAQLRGGVFTVVWTDVGPGLHYADVERTSAGNYRVVTCYGGFRSRIGS